MEQTSSIFREGLTNKTAAEEATKMRRSSDYRKSLLNDLNRLEKQIQEFEVLLLKQEEQKLEKMKFQLEQGIQVYFQAFQK